MKSPPPATRVRVDGQGRMVLPRSLRDDVVTIPGEVDVRRTPDGLLITAAERSGEVREAEDGLPVLAVGRRITNDEVIAAIGHERADR